MKTTAIASSLGMKVSVCSWIWVTAWTRLTSDADQTAR